MSVRPIDPNVHQDGIRESLTRIRRTLADMQAPDGLWTQVNDALSSPFQILGAVISNTPTTYSTLAARLQAIELYLLLSGDGGSVPPGFQADVDLLINDLYVRPGNQVPSLSPRDGLYEHLAGNARLTNPNPPGLFAALGGINPVEIWQFEVGYQHSLTTGLSIFEQQWNNLADRLDNMQLVVGFMLSGMFPIINDWRTWTVPGNHLALWNASIGDDRGAGYGNYSYQMNEARILALLNEILSIPELFTRITMFAVYNELFVYHVLISIIIRQYGHLIRDLKAQRIFGGTAPPF